MNKACGTLVATCFGWWNLSVWARDSWKCEKILNSWFSTRSVEEVGVMLWGGRWVRGMDLEVIQC